MPCFYYSGVNGWKAWPLRLAPCLTLVGASKLLEIDEWLSVDHENSAADFQEKRERGRDTKEVGTGFWLCGECAKYTYAQYVLTLKVVGFFFFFFFFF